MVKTSLKLYKGKTLKNGDHPFVIQLSMDRQVRRISTGESCHVSIWNEKTDSFRFGITRVKQNSKYFQELESKLSKKLTDTREFILSFERKKEVFSLDEIVSAIKNKDKKYDFYTYTQEWVDRLMKQGKVGNAQIYKDTLKAVERYHGKKTLLFDYIDFKFLTRLQEFWSATAGESTISVYMRTLRAIFNKAINEGFITLDLYPFRQYKISKLDTNTTPRPLLEDQLIAILDVDLEPDSKEEYARDLFFFSYYTRGINFTDIAYLTWGNIYDRKIHYTRKKIRSTSKKPVNFTIAILAPVQKILERYKNKDIPGRYIFPILNGDIHVTEKQKYYRLKRVSKEVNQSLKTLATKAKISEPVTFYYARHSWANRMRSQDVGTAIISEALGHQEERTTQIYLDKFSNDKIDQINNLALLNDKEDEES